MVAVGSTVQVTVAAGAEQVAMPDLRNKTEAQAVQEIVDRRSRARDARPRRSTRSCRSGSS